MSHFCFRKTTIGSIFFLFFAFNPLLSQECNFPLPPSNTCNNAPLLCDLDGYCSDNSGATNSGTPNAFCGLVENNNWISFIAGSETLEIKVSVYDCNNGSGLQVQVFETADCNFFIAKSNCLDPVPNNGEGTMTATNLEIGQIYYLMMDGKGGDVCHYDYELIEGITLSPAEATIEPPGYLCEGELLTIEATTWSSNPGIMPQWSTFNGNIVSGENSTAVVVDEPGIYNLFVEDNSGCTDSTSIEIFESANPIANAGVADTLNCLNNVTVTLNGGASIGPNPIDFDWTTNSGNIVSGGDTANPTVNEPGEYYLTVIDQVTLCSAIDTVEIFIDANTPFSVTGGGAELNCLVSEIELNGIGSSFGNNFTYQWTTPNGNIVSGAEGLFPVVDAPGIYELQVSNLINGCVATDAVEVTLNEEEPTGADISTFAPCFEMINGRIEIDSVYGGIPDYLFAFGDSILSYHNSAEYLRSGDYRITIKDQTGCEWDTIVTVGNEVQLIADLGEDFYLPLGCDYELIPLINIDQSQVDSFSWTPDELITCDTCFNQLIAPILATRTYHFSYTDLNGCSASDAITIYLDRTRNIFIPNVFSPNSDGVNDIFYINAGKDVTEIKSFRIFDRWGSLLHEEKEFAANDPTFGWDGKIQGKPVTGNVFTYVAEIEFLDGWIERFTGDVILMR